MTGMSEPVVRMTAPYPLRLAAVANWAVLWLVFAAAAAILACVAATQAK